MLYLEYTTISRINQIMKKLILLLFFSVSEFSQKTTIAYDSQVLGESREITIRFPV